MLSTVLADTEEIFPKSRIFEVYVDIFQLFSQGWYRF